MKPEAKPFMHILEKCFERDGKFEIPLIKKQEVKNEDINYTTYNFSKFMLIKDSSRSERK
jgi:hypothetical protein